MSATSRRMILGVLFLALSAGIASAQFNSGPSSVTLNWFDPENLWVQVNFGHGQFQMGLDGGAVTPTTDTISVSANYNGLVNRQTLTIYAYFADGARALSSGSGGAVPASNIEATITVGEVSVSRFNQTSPFSTASVRLVQSPAVATNGTGSLPASFSLAILGTNYPAGQYTGTLFVQAQAL